MGPLGQDDSEKDAFAKFIGDVQLFGGADEGGFSAAAAKPPSLDDIFGGGSPPAPTAAPGPADPFAALGGRPLVGQTGQAGVPLGHLGQPVLPASAATPAPNAAAAPLGDMLLDCRTVDEAAKEHRDMHAKPSVLAAFDATPSAGGSKQSPYGSPQRTTGATGSPPGASAAGFTVQQQRDPFAPKLPPGAAAPPPLSAGGAVPLTQYIPPSQATASPPKRADPFAGLGAGFN